jgi:hypothetical protein
MSSSHWEEDTAQDWAKVESRLAAWLTDVPAGDAVILEMPTPYDDLDGATPYVQVTVEDDGFVRGEAASNTYLDKRFALDDARIAEVEAMGWSAPTSGVDEEHDDGSTNFFVNLELPDDAEQLADLLVTTMRDVFGAPHPSFLTVTGFGSGGRLDAEAMPFGIPVAAPETTTVAIAPAMPEGADDLRDLVEAALATVVDHELTYDSDGDIPIYADGALIYVRVEEDSPSIRVFSPFLSDVRWKPRVGSALSDLNRRARYAKVIFSVGVLFATMQLYGAPFVPAHLCHAVEGIRALVTDVVDELHETLGGATFTTDASSGADGDEST